VEDYMLRLADGVYLSVLLARPAFANESGGLAGRGHGAARGLPAPQARHVAQLTKSVIEAALSEDMTEHPGNESNGPAGIGSGNIRNGIRAETSPPPTQLRANHRP
jgi:hypothetical protein